MKTCSLPGSWYFVQGGLELAKLLIAWEKEGYTCFWFWWKPFFPTLLCADISPKHLLWSVSLQPPSLPHSSGPSPPKLRESRLLLKFLCQTFWRSAGNGKT